MLFSNAWPIDFAPWTPISFKLRFNFKSVSVWSSTSAIICAPSLPNWLFVRSISTSVYKSRTKTNKYGIIKWRMRITLLIFNIFARYLVPSIPIRLLFNMNVVNVYRKKIRWICRNETERSWEILYYLVWRQQDSWHQLVRFEHERKSMSLVSLNVKYMVGSCILHYTYESITILSRNPEARFCAPWSRITVFSKHNVVNLYV